jgi:hypothetical protein
VDGEATAEKIPDRQRQHEDGDYSAPDIETVAKIRGKNPPAQQFDSHYKKTGPAGDQEDKQAAQNRVLEAFEVAFAVTSTTT